MTCNDCGESFKYLDGHIKRNINKGSCYTHKNVLFTCRLCAYACKSYKKILIHCRICEGILCLNKPTEEYEKKIESSEKLIDKYTKLVKDYERTIQIEKVYNNVLTTILNKTLKINISDIREDLSDGIHLYNVKEDDIPFIFHINDNSNINVINKNQDESIIQINLNNDIQYNKKISTILKPKKDRFRQIDCIELIKEIKDDEIKETVKNVDENIKETMILNFETINLEECQINISTIFNTIKEGKMYQKDLHIIKNIRSKMLGWLNIKEYEKLISCHIDILNDIFIEKKYDKQKRNKIIYDSFTSLELRLIKFGKYYEKMLDLDDIDRLRISMEVCIDLPKFYTPFKRGFKTFHNYNLVLFTLKKCIECNMINRYGFNNIVYIQMPNNKDNNPYSFYYLDKIENGKRCWKLDCRLEDISEEMSNTLLPYCVNLYKKIYTDMFGDNVFRCDIESIYPIAGNELDQLVENILILSNLDLCMELLKNIIKSNCIHLPTDIDRINIRTEDSSQRSRFKDYNKNYKQSDIIYSLYTIISEKDVDEIISKFKIIY